MALTLRHSVLPATSVHACLVSLHWSLVVKCCGCLPSVRAWAANRAAQSLKRQMTHHAFSPNEKDSLGCFGIHGMKCWCPFQCESPMSPAVFQRALQYSTYRKSCNCPSCASLVLLKLPASKTRLHLHQTTTGCFCIGTVLVTSSDDVRPTQGRTEPSKHAKCNTSCTQNWACIIRQWLSCESHW